MHERLADGTERELAAEDLESLRDVLGLDGGSEVEIQVGGLNMDELSYLMRGLVSS